MACQLGAKTVHKYGQKLIPGKAPGWTGNVRKEDFIGCQEDGPVFLVPFLCSEFFQSGK